MQYFKHLINKFCFKVKSSNLFKFFFGCVFLFFFIPSVHASEIIFGYGAYFNIGTTIRIDDTHNSIPYTFTFSSNPMNYGAIGLSLSPSFSGSSTLGQPIYNYLYLQMCNSGTVNLNVSNSSTTGSFLVTGAYTGYDLGTTGTVTSNNWVCHNYLYQIPIGKWKLDEISGMFEVDSYFNFERVSSSGNGAKITKVFMSDEDLFFVYNSQAAINSKLSDIDTAITTMQNSLNNNIDQESTNIQNKIDAAKNQAHQDAQQAHTDATNIKNSVDSIKNQDHTYNNNASDTVPNSSDINSVINQENSLRSDLDLDVSTLDIQLNTDATTWIWGIVNNIRTINGKITLLFTTILSLAIIKMVLNR